MTRLQARDEGAVRVLTLSRPPGNELDLALLGALRAAAEDAGRDARVRAVLLESAVAGYFSSGLDLGELHAQPEGRRGEHFTALIAAYRAWLGCPKPVVAALSGSALLGGWIVAMACDWRLLGRGAKISLAEIRAGLTPTSALIARAQALACDPRVVKEMVLRGRPVGADEALAAGLVDEVLPAEEVGAEALRLAGRLAKSPPRAYAAVKRALNASAADDALWRGALAEFDAVFSGDEAREGLTALRAKRRPRWEGA